MYAHDVPQKFPRTVEALSAYDVVILSDIGANSFVLPPETWLEGKGADNPLRQPGGVDPGRRRADDGRRLPELPGLPGAGQLRPQPAGRRAAGDACSTATTGSRRPRAVAAHVAPA